MANSHYDVIIVGAGLSGIGAARHLIEKCPNKSYAILEAREAMGGTWDLFRYPGIRSDSDMFTLGYSFKPWVADEAIADGPAILSYIHEAAKDGDIDQHIKYNNKVSDAVWSSESANWTIATNGKEENQYSCNFLFMCSGYYDYDGGHMPTFEGVENYKGQLVHPQKWTKDIDYTNKKVIVIGSGATAVTLVPELGKKAKEVTMLQRSPTYVVTAPQKDAIANTLRKLLPSNIAYSISRWKNIIHGYAMFNACRKWPKTFRKLIVGGVKKEMGPDYDMKHFSPDYNPWDQRLCLVPDSDLFISLKKGESKIVTDHIDHFTENGIKLKSGEHIEADLVVSATGLKLKMMSGIKVVVDGQTIVPADTYCYRGMMFSNMPNMALAFGYTNASWTLKCDLTCAYVCRLLNYMDKKKYSSCVPIADGQEIEDTPFLDFTSGYIQRELNILPKQGTKRPWKVFQNYFLDLFNYKYSSFKDGVLQFN